MKLEDRHEQDTAPWGLHDCYRDGGDRMGGGGGTRRYLVMSCETGELMWRLAVDAREGLAAGVFAPTAIWFAKGGASLQDALKIERIAAEREARGRPAAAARLRMLLTGDRQVVIDASAPFL